MPLDPKGYEVPDPRPVEMPSRLRLPQNRADQIRSFIRSELSRQAEDQGHESFQEADDFDMEEVDFSSAYEVDFDPPGDAEVQRPGGVLSPAGGVGAAEPRGEGSSAGIPPSAAGTPSSQGTPSGS